MPVQEWFLLLHLQYGTSPWWKLGEWRWPKKKLYKKGHITHFRARLWGLRLALLLAHLHTEMLGSDKHVSVCTLRTGIFQLEYISPHCDSDMLITTNKQQASGILHFLGFLVWGSGVPCLGFWGSLFGVISHYPRFLLHSFISLQYKSTNIFTIKLISNTSFHKLYTALVPEQVISLTYTTALSITGQVISLTYTTALSITGQVISLTYTTALSITEQVISLTYTTALSITGQVISLTYTTALSITGQVISEMWGIVAPALLTGIST